MKTKLVSLTYGRLHKLPSFKGDTSPATYTRQIFANGCEPWEAASALEKAGFHVSHPVNHPNGSGGRPAMVFAKPGQSFPKSVTV